jgi:hypothetical protein
LRSRPAGVTAVDNLWARSQCWVLLAPVNPGGPLFLNGQLTTASSYQFCSEGPNMRNVSHASAAPAPLASDFRVEKKERSIFAFVTSALHRSRRLQAHRILRQYEHLIAHPKERIPHELNQSSGGQEMPVASRPAQARLAARLPAPNWMGWPVAVAVAFLVIHVIAGTIWLRASANEATTSRQEAISSLYD